MKYLIYMMMALVGLILGIGTVGAADQEAISFSRLVVQILIADALMIIACFGIDLEEKREANRRKYKRGKRKSF